VDIAIAQGDSSHANIAALAQMLIEIALDLQAGKRPAAVEPEEEVPF
jgi:hypothetical protein